MKCISILGAGNYAMAFAHLLSEKGHTVRLWSRNTHIMNTMNQDHYNPLYLPEIKLNSKVRVEMEFPALLDGAEYLINALPVNSLREVFQRIIPYTHKSLKIINGSKGIEQKSLKLISEVFQELLPSFENNIAYLSGPSFAQEIVNHTPTAVDIASVNKTLIQECKNLFKTDYFFAYPSDDITGIQISGALKNVIAISLGIAEGCNFGKNTQAALIVIGMNEITQLGIRKGAQLKTFQGLTGLGDLVLTCTGNLSRNRQIGIQIAHGKSINTILAKLGIIAEGVKTTHAAYHLASSFNLHLPLIETVYRVLYENADPCDSVKNVFHSSN